MHSVLALKLGVSRATVDFCEEEAVGGHRAVTLVAQGERRLRWALIGPNGQNSWVSCRIKRKRKGKRGGELK
jgi:hypothetical protein